MIPPDNTLFRYEALTPGSRDHVVLYDDELFSMLDDRTMEIFLRQPWKYNRTPLPAKLPPARVAQDVTSLPMLGFVWGPEFLFES
jgi:hypothetical protein